MDWIKAEIDKSLLIAEVTRGKGIFEKSYFVVKVPDGYGYDGYCFQHSKSLVERGEHCYITFHREMKMELFLSEEKREEGKRYKRFKMDGQMLFDSVFSQYECAFKAERISREEQHQKKTIGSVVCGRYSGNNFDPRNTRYHEQDDLKVWFKSESGRFSNSEFKKVQNVKVEFEIKDNVSKFEFFKNEKKINVYLHDYQWFCDELKRIENTAFQTCEATKIFPAIADVYLTRCREVKAKLQECLFLAIGESQEQATTVKAKESYSVSEMKLLTTYEELFKVPHPARVTYWYGDSGLHAFKYTATPNEIQDVYNKALKAIGLSADEFKAKRYVDRADIVAAMQDNLKKNGIATTEQVAPSEAFAAPRRAIKR